MTDFPYTYCHVALRQQASSFSVNLLIYALLLRYMYYNQTIRTVVSHICC